MTRNKNKNVTIRLTEEVFKKLSSKIKEDDLSVQRAFEIMIDNTYPEVFEPSSIDSIFKTLKIDKKKEAITFKDSNTTILKIDLENTLELLNCLSHVIDSTCYNGVRNELADELKEFEKFIEKLLKLFYEKKNI